MPGNVEKMHSGAFRPFEKGPRHCVGMQLALMELKVVLVLVARLFDFEVCYDRPEPKVLGERAYPVLVITARPVDGLPVKVRRAEAVSLLEVSGISH